MGINWCVLFSYISQTLHKWQFSCFFSLGHSLALCLFVVCILVTCWNTEHSCLSASDSRFATSLLYYGLCLNVGSFGINIYVTQFIFGAVEIPASMVSLTLNQRVGRRLSQSSSLIFGGAACLLTLAVPQGTLDSAYTGMQGRKLEKLKGKDTICTLMLH